MRNEHIKVLKDYVECKLSAEEWRSWLTSHGEEIEADSGRFVRLRLEHRGFRGVQAVIEEQEVGFHIPDERCRGCGAPMFEAIPGVTTPDEIRGFAESSRLRGMEQIARDGWIHPGRHCPNGCTTFFCEYRADEQVNINPPGREVIRLHRATGLGVLKAQQFIAIQPTQLIQRILQAADEQTDGSALRDPIENAPDTAETIASAFARAERETDADVRPGYFRGRCYAVWHRVERILHDEFGIEWFSPARMNPGSCFD